VKKTHLITGVLVLIVALAMGYFVGVPLAQIKQEKSLEAKHKQVNDKLAKVYDSFKRDIFTKAGTPSGTAKADVKVGMDAVKDARSELNADAPALTKFSALPFLDWNQTYHTAKSLDAREEQYVKDARAFLDQYDTLLVYTDKSADLQAQIEAATKEVETIGENDTPVQLAAKLDAAASKLQPLVEQAKTITPPSYLKDLNDQELALGSQLVGVIRDLATGARKLDLKQIASASTRLDQLSSSGNSLDQAMITKLQRDSDIQQRSDALRTTGDQLGHNFASL
jgi:hypothetical protein